MEPSPKGPVTSMEDYSFINQMFTHRFALMDDLGSISFKSRHPDCDVVVALSGD